MKHYFWHTHEGKRILCPHVNIRIDVGHHDLPPHVQDDFSTLAFIHRGTGTKLVGRQRYDLCDRSVYVIHSKVPHAYIGTRELYLSNFCYTEELWKALPPLLQTFPGFQALFHIEPIFRHTRHYPARLVLDKETFDLMIEHMETLLALEEDHPAATLVSVCRVTEIFARLSLAYEQQNDDSGRHDLPLKLARVVLWIEQNLDQPLSNTEIADFAHVSPRSLSRLFQEIYRETPKEFVARLRFRKACDLLRNSEHNISEIGFLCGFSDSNYFSRQFHKVFGCQPREFRKQQGRLDR